MVKVKVELQGKKSVVIECENFSLKDAVDVINGVVKEGQENSPQGFMVGDNHYFRALEVVSIEIV